MEPLAAWELGLSGNSTRQPLPALPRPLQLCFARGVPPGVPPPHHSTPQHPVEPMQPTPKTWTGLAWLGQCLFLGAPGWMLGMLGTAVALSPWPERQEDAPQAVSMAAAAWSKCCEVWAAGQPPPPCFPLLETSSGVPSWCAPASCKGHCGPLQSATRGQGPLALSPCLRQAPRLATPAWGCRALYGRAPTSPGPGSS